MKKYKIFTIVPVLALLVAGCSTPVAMQSTEYDDMYYTSSDQTVYTQPEVTEQRYAAADQVNAPAPSETENINQPLREGEVLNPEYSGNASGMQNYADDEYYDGRSYEPRDNWYRPNYSFVDPYWGSAYVPRYNPYSAFSYNPYYNSYNAYDPFFSPYGYDPYFSRPFYGSGLSFSLGYSMGWGSAFGRRPYYNTWYPYNNYYNGYYGGGYNNYYGHSPYYNGFYDRPIVLGKPIRVQNGPRGSRGTVVTGDAQRTNGRPERGNAALSSEQQSQQRVQDSQRTGRPSRRTAPDNTIRPVETQTTEALPARPSRRNRSGSGDDVQSRPATIDRSQEQRQQAQPARERRTREYTPAPARERVSPPVQRQQPVQRETRSYESRPSRSYETQSSPSRSFEPSRSSSPSPASSGSNSGGGRPSRGRGN